MMVVRCGKMAFVLCLLVVVRCGKIRQGTDLL
jgi:hypothetical protein